MEAPLPRRATYEDVLRAPPHRIAQVLHGVLHTHSRSMAHAATSVAIGTFVGRPFCLGLDGPGGWLLLKAFEAHLGPEPDIVVPDIAAWRLDRGELPGGDIAWTTIAPDWVCEILSPSTQQIDRHDKMQIYLREGVRHVWLADPDAESLEVYRHRGDAWEHRATLSQHKAHIEPFEPIELDVGLFWRF